MERTNIIVWLDNNEEWNRVYIENGKLYVKIGPGNGDYALLSNCFVRKTESIC